MELNGVMKKDFKGFKPNKLYGFNDKRLDEIQQKVYSSCGVPKELLNQCDSPSVALAKTQVEIFESQIRNLT